MKTTQDRIYKTKTVAILMATVFSFKVVKAGCCKL